MDKATISSYVMLIMIPVFTYFGFSEATQSAICGVIVAVLLLIGQVYNEKHNSTLFSGGLNVEEENDQEGGC